MESRESSIKSLKRAVNSLVVLGLVNLIFILRYVYSSFCVNFWDWKNQLLPRSTWRVLFNWIKNLCKHSWWEKVKISFLSILENFIHGEFYLVRRILTMENFIYSLEVLSIVENFYWWQRLLRLLSSAETFI